MNVGGEGGVDTEGEAVQLAKFPLIAITLLSTPDEPNKELCRYSTDGVFFLSVSHDMNRLKEQLTVAVYLNDPNNQRGGGGSSTQVD